MFRDLFWAENLFMFQGCIGSQQQTNAIVLDMRGHIEQPRFSPKPGTDSNPLRRCENVLYLIDS